MQASTKTVTGRISAAIENGSFLKLVLGNKRDKNAEVRNITAKLISLKDEPRLSFVYRYPAKDITKNYPVKNGIELIEKHLLEDFLNADIFTITHNIQYFTNDKDQAKMVEKAVAGAPENVIQTHDKQKQYSIQPANNIYLQQLGITSADGHVKKDKQDKYRQINHYIEIIDGIVKDLQLQAPLHIADMGCGKGYLTFALYDYLHNKLKVPATITGVEMRPELVATCNAIAAKAGYNQLHFETGTIASYKAPATDMLIALHACDTATDDAIFKGIEAGAKVIVVAPCCHKQIRKQMKPANELTAITKHGILLERQAEIVTDSMRSLILEMQDYKTKVFEFIATEHTPKNVLIVATKRTASTPGKEALQQKLYGLKALFGIDEHYLEKLVNTRVVVNQGVTF